MKNIFIKLNKSCLLSTMSFYDNNYIGNIMNRVSNDINKISDTLPNAFADLLLTIF
jgi:hypothetical protein